MSTLESVTLEWVHKLPLKEQSALFSGLRGPDHLFCKEVKKLSKFIRQATQINADVESGYMEENWKQIDPKHLERELEFCSLHYVCHLIEALTIIANNTDCERDCLFADETIKWFNQTFHLKYHKEL